MPAQEVPLTEAPEPEDFAAEPEIERPFRAAVGALDMRQLAEASPGDLPGLLLPLAEAYEAWIASQERRLGDPQSRLGGHEVAAARHLADARLAATRIRAGIAALAEPLVAEAFAFANHVMWQQRVHTVAADLRRHDDRLKLADAVMRADQPHERSWRPFQLAFVLLNLPALADPRHPERSGERERGLVDLLFFPTGGGKTEAYLGLTAFALAIRRLAGTVEGRQGCDGVAVLMRYTLRLLTLQQFQRAAALLCACELRRRALYADGRTAEAAAVGRDADAGRLVGRDGLDAQPDRGRRGMGQAGAPAQRRPPRLVADAARPLSVVWFRAERRPRCRGRHGSRPDAADVFGLARGVPVHAAQQPRRGPPGGGGRRGDLPAAAGARDRHRRQAGADAVGGKGPVALRPGLALLRAPRLPDPRRPASRSAPVQPRPAAGAGHAVRAAAPAGSDHPGRAPSDQRSAREPRRAVRDGG